MTITHAASGTHPDLRPFTDAELLEAFHGGGSFSKHLLTVYSMAVAMNAQTILDLGIGLSAKALRLAASKTGGTVFSCDMDAGRYSYLLDTQDEHWKLSLTPSETLLREVAAPLDFVLHDCAHDFFQVKMDLEIILPKMRTYGLVCIHDTQQFHLNHDMLLAVREAAAGWQVSLVTLPYACGLTILRVEKGNFPAAEIDHERLPDGSPDTKATPFPMNFGEAELTSANSSLGRWARWRLRKIVKGY